MNTDISRRNKKQSAGRAEFSVLSVCICGFNYLTYFLALEQASRTRPPDCIHSAIHPRQARASISSCDASRRCSRYIGTASADTTAAASRAPSAPPVISAAQPHNAGTTAPPA